MGFIEEIKNFKFGNVELGCHFCSFLRKSHLYSQSWKGLFIYSVCSNQLYFEALDEDERAEWVTELEKCRDFSDSGNGIEVEDLEMEDIGDYVRVHHMFSRILDFLFAITGSSRLMRISLLRISLLQFFKTITKIWLMRLYGLFILLLRT